MTTKVPSNQIVKIDALRLALSMAGNDAAEGTVTIARAQKFYDFITAAAPVSDVKVPAKRGRKPKAK